MDEAIRKANVLIEALNWIRQFRNRFVVIKLGGSTQEDQDAVRKVLTDIIFMETVGMRPILVHGGGKAISRAMQESGTESRFVHGRRYTDENTIEIVSRVLAEDISTQLVQEIALLGGKAKALNYLSDACLYGEQLQLQTEQGVLDLGRVGQITHLNQALLAETCAAECIPVLAPIALDEHNRKLNVNADTAAASIAKLLKAEKLVMLSDVPGILLDRTDPDSLVSHLSIARCRELIADGTIEMGMVPKIEAALDALQAGVRKVHIVDAAMPHSLLLEIYSNQGIGTEIVREQ